MRNAKFQLLAVSVLLLLVVMTASSVQSREAPCSPDPGLYDGVQCTEVELNDQNRRATKVGGMSMRRLQTDRPSPLGYPPPPIVAELSPSPSPSEE